MKLFRLIIVVFASSFGSALLLLQPKTPLYSLHSLSAPHKVISASPRILRNRAGSSTQLSFLSPDLDVALYDLQLSISNVLNPEQLSSLNGATLMLLYGAGLFTAFSPCTIGLLPLTLLYLGGGENGEEVTTPEDKRIKVFFYALGIALVFSTIGLSAASLGAVFGAKDSQFTVLGDLLKAVITLVYFVMGLNLLEIVHIQFPSLDFSLDDGSKQKLPGSVEAMLFGGTSALIASPCSSPILVSILTFVATNIANPIQGALLLFIFSCGYATPVVTAGAFSGAVVNNILFTRGSPWVNNVFAFALLSYSSYSIVDMLNYILA